MWPQILFPWFRCIQGNVLLPALDDAPSLSLTKTWVLVSLILTHRFAVTRDYYYVTTEYYFDSFFLFDCFTKMCLFKTYIMIVNKS
jgi:hypothetical protein